MSSKWSDKDIERLKKLYPYQETHKVADLLNRTFSAVRTKALKIGLKKEVHSGIVFTEEKKAVLFDLYPNTKNSVLAQLLGVTECSIIAVGFRYKLRKSKEFMREHTKKGMFKKGQTVWNKGMKGLDIGGKETRFKKGQVSINKRPVGSERLTKDGYLEIKVADPKIWKGKHIVEWVKFNGKVPKGHIVVFKTEDKLNTSISNLELITRVENMKRNTVHNYPKEISLAVQLRGALNRQIRKHTKKLAS